MASMRERTLSSGEKTFQVLYRHGGKQTSMTFGDGAAAEIFRLMVDKHGPDRALKLAEEGQEISGLTVAQLTDRFLEWKADRVTPRTAQDYRRDAANWITPHLGHRDATTVDERDVQQWVDLMARTLSPKSVADRHMLLSQIFDFGRARSRQLVDHNPCKETELPKRAKGGAPKGTTTPEFRALLQAARTNPDARDLVLFLGETGWRFSEATALAVRDVEDDGVNVWATVARVTRIDEHGQQYIAEDQAKTLAAFRRIRMFPEAAAMIRRRLVGKGPADLVFTNSHGRHWNQNTFLRETWPRIVQRAELGDRRPTPHWLRHMHVAVCAAAGVPMHEIQRRIGHENYSTTVGVYGGMIGDMSDEALATAAALMSGRRTAPSIAPAVAGEVVQVLEALDG